MVSRAILNSVKTGTARFLRQARCRIEQQATTRGELGERIGGWEVVADDVPCRVITIGQERNSSRQEIAHLDALVDSYRLSVPPGTHLGDGMRVVVYGSALDGVYNVVNVRTDHTDEVERQAIITKVKER
jgi:hypothetical protein